MIGPISLDMKRMGARSAGNPHAACDVEGAGNVARSNSSAKPARHTARKLSSRTGSSMRGAPFIMIYDYNKNVWRTSQ